MRSFEVGSAVIKDSNIPDILTDSLCILQKQILNVRIAIIWPSHDAKLVRAIFGEENILKAS